MSVNPCITHRIRRYFAGTAEYSRSAMSRFKPSVILRHMSAVRNSLLVRR